MMNTGKVNAGGSYISSQIRSKTLSQLSQPSSDPPKQMRGVHIERRGDAGRWGNLIDRQPTVCFGDEIEYHLLDF
jgi:hypothetical protein